MLLCPFQLISEISFSIRFNRFREGRVIGVSALILLVDKLRI